MEHPESQKYLNATAKKYYTQICVHLEGADALEEIDSFGLSMMAHSLDLYKQAAEKINDPSIGVVQTYSTGAQQVSAWFSVMKNSLDYFLKYSQRYGMTPKDRELMIKFKVKRNEKDALTDL